MGNIVHDDVRSLFQRMTDIGRAIEISMKVIAFWLWLEPQGFENLIAKIASHDDEFLALVVNEAEIVLSTLKMDSKKSISRNLMCFTLTLSQCFVSTIVIFSDMENVLKGITDIYESLKMEKMTVSTSPLSLSKLNPCAKEWNPVKEKAPEEDRCLFLTFSNGYPLTEAEIIKFFTWKYGECVERVYVHWQEMRNGKCMPALFGKVVFKASYIPALILDGQNESKFWVDRKPLWCKRFDPEKKKTRNNN